MKKKKKHMYDILSQYIIPKVTAIYLGSCKEKILPKNLENS